MAALYAQLAAVYQAMYKSFIKYDEEFLLYNNILLNYNSKTVLEIGCGTGNLAPYFTQQQLQYTGLDQSADMLRIAKEYNPESNFVEGDMRDFELVSTVEACIITGRTISYLITNEDVRNTFIAVHNNLNEKGIICFDFIDAEKFIPFMDPTKKITHTATDQQTKYQRDSYWSLHKEQPGAIDWASIYYKENEAGELVKLGEDRSTIRCFYRSEMINFLRIAGFEVREIIERTSYAFETIVLTAQKIN